MELVCLLISLAIFSSYYVYLSSQHTEGVLYKLLTASLFTCAQIIMSELFLGLFRQLYISFLIIVNLSIAVLVLAMGRRLVRSGETGAMKNDFLSVKDRARAAIDRHALVLGTIALLTYGWILVAAYYLPPRGIDDNAYHLPAIFEYVRSHEIRLLPLDMRWHFAFPENAELLFMWPVMFLHEQRWVDGMNVPFVLLSVMAIYSLFRHFEFHEKNALFAALLYALCPVVLMLSGVNYIDIIVSLFLLLSLYYSILFYERRRLLDLYCAGLSIGLMCGMKYTGVLLAIPLQALIIPALLKGRWRHGFGYVSVIVFVGGWWYVRNALLLGDPLYPMQILASLPRAVRGTRGGTIIQNVMYNIPYWIVRYPLCDSGVGTFDGGFGLVFWGMGFSSWLYVTVQSLVRIGRTKYSALVALAYLPVGFLVLLILPPQWVDVDGRFSMFVVVIGLFAFSKVLWMIKDEVFVSVIKGLCIALSIITVSLMSISNKPSYALGGAISDAISHAEPSEYKYLADSVEALSVLRPAWKTLDILTRNDPAGLNCSIASDYHLYTPAPVYGSKLQNVVLNMGTKVAVRVDAYVCTYLNKDILDRPVPAYDRGRQRSLTIRNIMAKDDYVAVIQTENACLMLHRDIFNQPDKQRVLQTYYRNTWPEAAALAEKMVQLLDANVPIITSSEIGYGVRYVDIRKGKPNRVHLSFEHKEEEVASEKNVVQCYTFQRPLSGYRSRKISQVVYQRKNVDVYLNRRS